MLRPMRKNKNDPKAKQQQENPTSSTGVRSSAGTIIKQAIQDRAIDYIKGGNIEAFSTMCAEGSNEIRFLNRFHTKSGKHALAVAAEEGRIECIDVLLKSKAIVDLKDQQGFTATMYAAKSGETKILKLLIEAEADISLQQEETKETALFLASRYNHLDSVKLLVEYGGSIDVVNFHLETPLTRAIKFEYYDIALFLLQCEANINIPRIHGDTVLHTACFEGRLFTVNFILDNGGNIDVINNNDETPLMIACRHNHCDIVELLLNRGALANKKDKLGKSALTLACLNQNERIILQLLEYKADPNMADIWGYIPLTFICRLPKPNLDIINLLIKYESFVDGMDRCFATPLMHACVNSNFEAAIRLLQYGADINLKDIHERTVFDLIKNPEDRQKFIYSVDELQLKNSSLILKGGIKEKPEWLRELYLKK